MKTFKEVINSWDRQIDMAADLNLKPINIAAWYRRDSIPGVYFEAIVEAAKARRFPGITRKLLCQLADNRTPTGGTDT